MTIELAICGQVCFYRCHFPDVVKPWKTTTEPVGPLRAINKAAWGAKLLPTSAWLVVLRISKSLQHVKTQSEKRDPLHHLPPFHVLKKAASDVEDHVFCFALYECVAKVWKSSV